MQLLLIILCGILGSSIFNQQLSPVDEKSEIRFRIRNLGIGVNGSFKGLKGKIAFDPGDPVSSSFETSIDVQSINTGINMRDNHLRSADYFDAKSFPEIKFVSEKVSGQDKQGAYTMKGKLTIKKTTRELTFPFTATPEGDGIRFKGEFKINRRDFGVGGYNISLSDNLTVFLSVFAKKSEYLNITFNYTNKTTCPDALTASCE